MEPERDEEQMRALFDRTASTPDGTQLTKLRARAQDVTLRPRARPWWRIWAPALVFSAAALAVALTRTEPTPAPAAVAAESAPALHENLPVPAESVEDPARVAEAPEQMLEPTDESFDDVFSEAPLAGFGGLGEEPEDWLSPLDSPADEEVDIWLSAAGAFLEDG